MKKKLFIILLHIQCLTSNNLAPVLNMWQSVDKDGDIYPWFTSEFLKELSKWDMSEWNILEWGSGYSTLWFAKNCKSLTTIEHSEEWGAAVKETLKRMGRSNVSLKIRPGRIRPGKKGEEVGDNGTNTPYVDAASEDNKKYDCIVIDGVHRNDCAFKAIEHIKPGGIIILDNADQQSIGLNSTPTFNLLKQYKLFQYFQKNHADWQTAYWIIQ